jgi:hypothetical protein
MLAGGKMLRHGHQPQTNKCQLFIFPHNPASPVCYHHHHHQDNSLLPFTSSRRHTVTITNSNNNERATTHHHHLQPQHRDEWGSRWDASRVPGRFTLCLIFFNYTNDYVLVDFAYERLRVREPPPTSTLGWTEPETPGIFLIQDTTGMFTLCLIFYTILMIMYI